MKQTVCRLPIDTPLIVSRVNAATNRGLSYSANLGTIPSPIRKPFTQWISSIFPWVKGTDVSPDAIAPKFGMSENNYSPSFHRPAETVIRPVEAQAFRAKSKGAQRVVGKTTPWPFAQPTYKPLLPGVND